ncbi:2c0cb8fd-29d5-460d-9789-5af2ab26cb71 [Sclerotinia trifoliorum]|uniref:2c0cb8fd-29d5-460d-9789-5af2ab26cb71 n=1 Tax=Sclerotinia trifoliorum TaxID=28548 RepID=A0A8H2ZNC9_9HELO|nr:2c0cb8fd-29d5-460d-9789-5af2ab26cb71 [Sclerotinia trifoliorum]
MATLQGLSRVRLVPNKNYKRSGIKSYVYLLNKWGFEPTLPGPYFQMNKATEREATYHKFGHKSHHHKRHLAKKTPNGENGEVPAQDQQNDSEYLCPVQIGTPAQTLMLDFDTGSSDLWVWSTELPKSTTSKATGHTIFDPTKSSTFKASKSSKWQISYGDSSSASGTVGTDTVTIGGLAIKNQGVELATKLSAQFEEGAGDGLLGLAWGSINTVTPEPVATPVMNMITQKDIPSDAELFTVNLSSWRDAEDPDKGESFYTFGYIDKDVVGSQEISYTPVDNSQGFWMFDSTSATVNGKTITQSSNQAIADTGTTLALVSDETCQAIYNAIPGSTYDSTQQGYTFPSNTSADDLPVVTFAVGGKQFAVQKEDLGFADAGNGMVYGGIQSRGSMTFDILGDTFLKGIYAIFDQGNVRFGAVQRNEATQNTSAPPS